MAESHWSTPNGCHQDCPVCAAERSAESSSPVAEEHDPPGVHHVVLVHDRNASGSALYIDGGLATLSTYGTTPDPGFLARIADDLQGLRLDFSVITVAKPADSYFPPVFDKCLLWQPQDYNAETIVLPQLAAVVEPVVVTLVQDKHTYRQGMYVGGSLRTCGKPVPAAAVSEQMGDVPVVFRFVLTTLGPLQQFPMRLQDCTTRPATLEQFKLDAEAAAEIKPTSTEWAAAFVEANGRFPHALEYADAGYDQGSQCACTAVGDCVLREATVNHCDRNCYTRQLQDYIVLSGKDAKVKPPVLPMRITVAGVCDAGNGRTAVVQLILEALQSHGIPVECLGHDPTATVYGTVADRMRRLLRNGLTVVIDKKILQKDDPCRRPCTQ